MAESSLYDVSHKQEFVKQQYLYQHEERKVSGRERGKGNCIKKISLEVK